MELEKELAYTRESLQASREGAGDERGIEVGQRGDAVEQRGAAVDQRGTRDLERGAAVGQRGAGHGQRGAQSKIEQLSRTENDMKNLLDSTDIATTFLDHNFHIKRFNTSATRVVNLIPSDVGRPIDDVTSKIDYPSLPETARDVMDRLTPFMTEVKTRTDEWFSMRIVPYQSVENVIDGVVMTFTDITESKRVARERAIFVENVVQTVREPLLVLDLNSGGHGK